MSLQQEQAVKSTNNINTVQCADLIQLEGGECGGGGGGKSDIGGGGGNSNSLDNTINRISIAKESESVSDVAAAKASATVRIMEATIEEINLTKVKIISIWLNKIKIDLNY